MLDPATLTTDRLDPAWIQPLLGWAVVGEERVDRIVRGMRTHIICLGNELVGDDGIGIRVGRVLSTLPLPASITVELRASLGFELLDLLEGLGDCDQLMLVDATSLGGRAGTCTDWSPTDRDGPTSSSPCCHLIGVTGALEILQRTRRLDAAEPPRRRPRLVVVGIEGEHFGEYTTRLGEATRAALPDAVDRVLSLAGASAELAAKARAGSAFWQRRDPTILEVCSAVEGRAAERDP